MDAPALSYPWLNTISLEYHVTESLDGSTNSPPFVLPPDPAAVLDPDSNCVLVFDPNIPPQTLANGKIVRTVANLGLIDLTGGVQRGATADRLLRSVLIIGPTAVVAVAQFGRAFDGAADPQGQIVIPLGSNGIDDLNCLFVPQTGQMVLRGMTATPGNPILVRLGIWQPATAEELAEMQEACCCRASVFNEDGEPFFTTAIFSAAACARTVTAAVPNTAVRGVGLTAVNISGTGFAAGDIVRFVHEDGLGEVPVFSTTFFNPTLIGVILDVDGAVPLGAYDIFVAPPLNPPQCQGIGPGLFTVT